MPTLPPRYNWGTEVKNVNPTLYNQLDDSFTTIARVLNTKSSRHITTTNPPSDGPINAIFELGDFWVNQSTDTAWIMTSRQSNTQATWTQIT
jgi:hypothetical protein